MKIICRIVQSRVGGRRPFKEQFLLLVLNRLNAGARAVARNEQFSIPVEVHIIQPVRIAVVLFFNAQVGAIRNQTVVFRQRVRIAELISLLTVMVYVNGFRVTIGSDQLSAGVFLCAKARVENAQLSALAGMVPGEDAQNLAGAGNAAGVKNRRREPAVVAVERRLTRAFKPHLEQTLRVNLTAVVVIPAGVKNLTFFRQGWVVVVNLIDGYAAQIFAVFRDAIEIGNLGIPAVDNLNAAGGVKQDVAVGQAARLVVCIAQPKGELRYFLRFDVHSIEMVVVQQVRLLHGKDNVVALERDVRVANDPARAIQQKRLFNFAVFGEFQHPQLRAGAEMAFRVGVGQSFRIGVMGTVKVVTLYENESGVFVVKERKPLSASGGAGFYKQSAPAGIGARLVRQSVEFRLERAAAVVEVRKDFRQNGVLFNRVVFRGKQPFVLRRLLSNPVVDDRLRNRRLFALRLQSESKNA